MYTDNRADAGNQLLIMKIDFKILCLNRIYNFSHFSRDTTNIGRVSGIISVQLLDENNAVRLFGFEM